jgi:hypothetical protein
MLSRYQKSGGFIQLLKLIEGFGPQKQEKFLLMIENENPLWAQAIKEKMISVKKIFSWDGVYIGEVVVRLPDLTIATALSGLSEEAKNETFKTLDFGHKKRIDELMQEKTPSDGEINSAFLRIVNEVRDMITQGALKVDKIDPNLHIVEKIEEKLAEGKINTSLTQTDSNTEENSSEGVKLDFSMAETMNRKEGSLSSTDLRKLQAKLVKLGQENNQLKAENKILKDKLTQIKKIA